MVREPISGKEELEFTPFLEQKLDDLIRDKNHRVTEMQTTSFSVYKVSCVRSRLPTKENSS